MSKKEEKNSEQQGPDNFEKDGRTQIHGTLPLRSDEPITSRENDDLGRGALVDIIGNHILATSALDPVVIALNAPWGAGKSSFLNMLHQHLVEQNDHEECLPIPLVVRFNPWHYSNVDQLVRMFFGELAVAMGSAKKRDIAKKAAGIFQVAAKVAGAFCSPAGVVLDVAADHLSDEKSLQKLKSELDELLPDLNQRLIIFIDDIDRLERNALRMLFQLVRLNADFANTTYVLAFDRLVVESNLDEEKGIKGRDYLEKIVQVSFDIPPPEDVVLQQLLFREMDKVLAEVSESSFDSNRWGNLFHSGFKNHFRTIRHIKRYVNGLRLTFRLIMEEVDTVDFLAVELIRVFHPEVYQNLARMKDILAPVPTNSLSSQGVSKDVLSAAVDELCNKASDDLIDSIKQILREVFPELERLHKNIIYGYGSYQTWRRHRRLCANDAFDRYFLLAVPGHEISEIFLRGFVSALDDEKATSKVLLFAHNGGKARRLLERLEDYTEDLTIQQAKGLLTALFDVGDELYWESTGFADFGSDMHIGRIVLRCLRRIESEDERVRFLVDLVQNGKALSTIVHEASGAKPNKDASVPLERQRLSDEKKWVAIRDAAVERIRTAAVDGTLWKSRRLLYTLYRWLQWTTEYEVQDVVKEHVVDDRDLLTLIRSFESVSHSFSMGDAVQKKHRYIRHKDVAAFLDVDEVECRLREISEHAEDSDLALEAANLLELMAKSENMDE